MIGPLSSEPDASEGSSRADALVAQAVRGDLPAAQELVRQVSRSVLWAVRSIVGPGHPDTDDIAQQSLIAFVQSLPRFRQDCTPVTYAIRIAVRGALAARRRQESSQSRNEPLRWEEENAAPIQGPAEHLQARRRRALIRALLSEVPEEQAEALALHVVLGLELKEVAQITESPLNTVKSRLRLVKSALRDRIAADPSLAEELGVAR